ncbi:hypothetical protein [Allobacillus saliphilus]|uniref:hypothetical protein n=1 Tax=Allobacillus saliphilus TaxID=2912308 RepID=UPI001BA9BCAF|nr:hypothetical protein [Allobacillus saliphilus]
MSKRIKYKVLLKSVVQYWFLHDLSTASPGLSAASHGLSAASHSFSTASLGLSVALHGSSAECFTQRTCAVLAEILLYVVPLESPSMRSAIQLLSATLIEEQQ